MAPISAPALGPDGQGCPQCGESLRSDQRYCLNCGRRRAQMRLPFLDVVGPPSPGGQPSAAASGALPPGRAGGASERSPLVALTALVALLLALGIGVLIGHGARGSEVVARAPVVNVAAAPAGGTSAATALVSDWPAQKAAWTVALRTLPGSTAAAAVAQAKQAATGKGAAAVGALRSDEFPSLPAGEIVIYSGMFEAKAGATKALRTLRKSFPEAKVVRVAAAGAAAAPQRAAKNAGATPLPKAPTGSGLSTSEYQKRSKKLPDVVKSEGAPPPADNKAPGGGSGKVTEIG